ncbi:MAG: PhnE/PtxC family ABC transporter permease, partial [bacterium]
MSESSITNWRTRMPAAFGPGPFRLGLRFLGLALFLVWFIGTLWYFDFSPARLWNGLSGLGKILVLMIPPSPGELWIEILKGLAESVAMAFLGTFLAALVAIPLGFMGARNVVTVTLLRFSFRRVL